MQKLKIGLLGAGHLGKIHLKCLQLLPDVYELVGFYEPQAERAASIAEELGLNAYSDLDELIAAVDVVDIVTPTSSHFEMAKKAIAAGKHIFVEKPITQTLEEGKALLALAQEAGIKGQVGFVERFNPAYLAMAEQDISPMFIEAHRLAPFNPRGNDVSVVLDLMIHDLDILLKLVNSPVRSVQASGVAIVSPAEDIANARIEFENRAVANITASRISMKSMRKFRLFQSDAYISMDFLEKKSELIRLYDSPEGVEEADRLMALETPQGERYLLVDQPETQAVNAIKTELELFAKSIIEDTEPTVSLEDGVKALELAYQILAAISAHRQAIQEQF